MLYYNVNYYHNRFFLIDNKYYIYLYINNKKKYIYHFELINDHLYSFIKNKDTDKSDNFSIKIMFDNKELKLNINNLYANYINLGNIHKFKYKSYDMIRNLLIFLIKKYNPYGWYIDYEIYTTLELFDILITLIKL
jgi:hypothetical protein